MVNLMELIDKRDQIRNARDYLQDEMGSQTETVLLTDEEVKMIIEALDNAVDYYEKWFSYIMVAIPGYGGKDE